MTRPNFTEIVAIIDKSTSMDFMTKETIAGFNKFLKEQKKVDGDANLSLILFNDQTEYLYDNVPIKKVKKLSEKTYRADGMTAMNDAVGSAIDKLGNRLSKMEDHERPSNIVVLIITDGQENSSREYETSKIKEMITTQQNIYSWEFIFLGANIDVDKYAADYGFSKGKFASYNQTSKGTTAVFDSMSMACSTERSRGIGQERMNYSLTDIQVSNENS
jgi:uncharacterized protein YegL